MAKFENPEDIKVIVATDCGSTTTKAILIEFVNGEYRLISRGEAPTTVEAPFEDVTMGVLNAVGELEELTGRKILDENGKFITPSNGGVGTDAEGQSHQGYQGKAFVLCELPQAVADVVEEVVEQPDAEAVPAVLLVSVR